MSEQFLKGVEQFNSQFFFEAHDAWEEVWMETSGPERLFYQGLIQLAVGMYHLSNRNLKGACSQLTKSLAKLEQYLPGYRGVDIAVLVASVRECLGEVRRVQRGELPGYVEFTIPQIFLN
jgi:predicted metal-dependent hydrolase